MPLVGNVLEHSSSRVAYDVYREVWDQVAEVLPVRCPIVLTADRGFAETHRMAQLTRLGWQWRSRITGSWWIDRHGKRRCQVKRIPLAVGKARFWPDSSMTQKGYGPVHLARGRPHDSQEYWFVRSDAPTEPTTFEAYGRRCDIEENFWDDTSNGFQLEASLIRSAKALERRCGVLAITTLYLVSHGTEVVTPGTRRWVDAHWFRGPSSLKIGWRWVQLALSRGYALPTSLRVSAAADPEPAMASKLQQQKQPPLCFALELQDAVA